MYYYYLFLGAIIGELKTALKSTSLAAKRNKAKSFSEQYLSQLVVDYSEELEDPELLDLVINNFRCDLIIFH